MKSLIERSVKEAGQDKSQFFFNVTLRLMCDDMSKGLSAIGHKFYLQYIAINYPETATLNMIKHSELRNSYQNRQAIGLSILWALGQCGLTNIYSGLQGVFRILFSV